MKLLYLKSSYKYNSFHVTIGIKILFFMVLGINQVTCSDRKFCRHVRRPVFLPVRVIFFVFNLFSYYQPLCVYLILSSARFCKTSEIRTNEKKNHN